MFTSQIPPSGNPANITYVKALPNCLTSFYASFQLMFCLGWQDCWLDCWIVCDYCEKIHCNYLQKSVWAECITDNCRLFGNFFNIHLLSLSIVLFKIHFLLFLHWTLRLVLVFVIVKTSGASKCHMACRFFFLFVLTFCITNIFRPMRCAKVHMD